MPPNATRRSSKTSIVSVDPAVARHITDAKKSTGLNLGHSRTESTPAQTITAQSSSAAKGHGRTISAPNRDIKKRSNSLRRAKNSTEILKQRSIGAQKNSKQAESGTVKRGRNFTVSNVTTGGTLHLSPSPHQGPFPTATPISASPYPWISPTVAVAAQPTIDIDAPTYSEPSQPRTRSVSPKRLIGRVALSKASKEFSHNHTRSQSFSTIDESRKSVAAAIQPKTLRIVINRPESAVSSEDEEDPIPTLEIPIPSYKLGTPRFSAHGTPFIRGASYTKESSVQSTRHPSMNDGAGGPPLSSIKAFSKLHRQMSSGESMAPMPDALQIKKLADMARSASSTSHLTPVSPAMYDKLAPVYHQSSVVRYATNEKDIAAATKIRIIAQISSEAFMDYDLVSDFFLTFRSYMTTFEVLDYLLARLKWAIGRLTDDGRIVRIRTFAALRHWILNYFAEDFVVNRHLRVRFCQDVNELYDTVKQRPKGVGGVSDLKILQDLKRCWNGRCALYWDAEEFNMDSDQEEPLLPGGVLGSRNPAYADISEATAALGLGLQNIPDPLSSPLSSTASRTTRRTLHKRLPSSEYAKKPQSIASDKSVQPTSCTLPIRRSPSPAKENESLAKGPQPVSVLARRQNAPADLKVHVESHNDEDTGGAEHFSMEQTPVEALVNSGHYVDPHAGSMIRGFVYGPVEPFIQLPSDPPASPSMRFSADQPSSTSLRIPSSPSVPSHHQHQGPAVKNIFGSIRRALSGKQGSNEVTLITVSTPRPSTSTGQRAHIPPNMARSNDDLRRKAAGVAPKTQLRIDLLCAAAVQSFQTVVPGTNSEASVVTQQQNHRGPQQLPSRTPFSPPLSSTDQTGLQPLTRLPSHYTDKSGSILIVDDTAVAMPVMSGALPDSYTHIDGLSASNTSTPVISNTEHVSFQTQIPYEEKENISPDEADLGTIGLARTTRQRPQLVTSNSSTVTIKKLEPSPDLEQRGPDQQATTESLRSTSPPSMTDATSKSESPVSKAPAHGLRRRPGGDLRKNQNVQDLETVLHHQSLDSMLDSSSTAGSLLIMGRPKTPASTQAKKTSKKVSMIHTHSSQHLRPSFEAQVADLTGLPDDDDGGLEATLLKLEGRYSRKSPSIEDPSTSPQASSFAGSSEAPLSASTMPTDQGAVGQSVFRKGESLAGRSFLDDDHNEPEQSQARSSYLHKPAVFGLPTESEAGSDSEESDISLPILKRSTTIGRAVTTDSPQPRKATREQEDDARSSSDILEAKHQDVREIARPGTAHTDGTRSFLLDEDENISDLSSEISVEILTYNGMGKPMSPMLAAPGTAVSGLEIPTHPLTHASLVNMSLHTSPALAGPTSFINQYPTPRQSPLLEQSATTGQFGGPAHDYQLNRVGALTAGPAHVPFILACESDVLAQQMTIVEQSALTEIEWTDLVEMRWSNDKSTSSLDWAEYMAKHDDARGIDVVTTRFNLVIKWVLSEIVLTQDIGERARVLSKFIHIAAHARRLRNYATMLQITIALMSTSCTRLKKTWELVPSPDRSLLKHMEKLAQPMRNFHELRLEMESTDLSCGCVPFLMLYVHDLTYNAQKPAEIHVDGSSEPLINFERFRTAAIIVKGLLRLIDASLRYDFEPIHGIIERCLWLSALTDDRIDALSKALE